MLRGNEICTKNGHGNSGSNPSNYKVYPFIVFPSEGEGSRSESFSAVENLP